MVFLVRSYTLLFFRGNYVKKAAFAAISGPSRDRNENLTEFCENLYTVFGTGWLTGEFLTENLICKLTFAHLK